MGQVAAIENLNNPVRQIFTQNPSSVKLPQFSSNDPEMWAKVDEVKSLTEKVASLKAKLGEVRERKSRDPKRIGRGNNNFYNNRGRSRGRPFHRQNYRGRGGGRGYHRSNSFGRSFYPQNDNFHRGHSRDRFRSSSPCDRSSGFSHHPHEQCCSRQHCIGNDSYRNHAEN